LLEIQTKDIMFNKPSESLIAYVHGFISQDKFAAMCGNTKVDFNAIYGQYEKEIIEVAKDHLKDEDKEEFSVSKLKMAVFQVVKYYIHDLILDKKTRIDDRPLTQVRQLYCEVGMLPRVHGSGLFRRGQTQVLTTATLGSVGDAETTDSMEEDQLKKQYIHHYNMHPFATNDPQGSR